MVNGSLRLVCLVELVNALDDAFGHVHKALQLGGGALEGREVAELIYCLTIWGMGLGKKEEEGGRGPT